MGIKLRVEINPESLLASTQKFKAAQVWLDNEIVKDCNTYVPYRDGNLATSGIRHTVIGSGAIVYKTPYAKKVYHSDGWNFNKKTHELATDHWLEVVKPLKIEKWKKGVTKILGGK